MKKLPHRFSGIALATALFLAGLAGVLRAEPPAINYVTQPVRHWEAFFVFGEGFGAKNVRVLQGRIEDERGPEELAKALLAGETLKVPEKPPEKPIEVGRINVLSPQAIGGILQGGVQMLWAKSEEGISAPFVVNRPEVFFAEFEEIAPGEECRLFGRNLVQSFYPPQPSLWLLDREKKAVHRCEWGNRFDYQGHLDYQLPYELRFKVPDSVPDGAYELWVHNGLKTGLHGVGGPVPLAVKRRSPSRPKLIDAREHGAKGDGLTDDSPALEKAVLAAAELAAALPPEGYSRIAPSGGRSDRGGATVYLPQGDYVLSRPLRVPPGVNLKGFRPSLSRLLVRPEIAPFSLECSKDSLKGKAQDWASLFRKMPQMPMVYLVSDSRVEDLGFVAAEPVQWCVAAVSPKGPIERIVIRHCEMENPHTPWVTKGYVPATACIGLLGYARFCEIRDCRLRGLDGISHVGTGFRCRMIGNRFSPTMGPFGTTGMGWMIGVNCIVEGNLCENSNRGFTCGPWHGPIERNFIARNGVVDGGSIEGGAESFLFEGPDVGRENWFGSPSAVGADWLEQTDQKWRADVLKGRVALVVHGRGFGQWRRVASNTENRVALAEPWGVQPDKASLTVVRQFFMQNILLNNTCRDTIGGIDFYGGALENTVERYVGQRARGVWIVAGHVADPKERLPFGPGWYNDARNCRFLDGCDVILDASRRTDMPTPAPLLCGNRIQRSEFRHSRYVADSRMLWTLTQTSWLPYGDPRRGTPPPALAFNSLDSCSFDLYPQETGVALDPETAGTYLWWLAWPRKEPQMDDKGKGTVYIPR